MTQKPQLECTAKIEIILEGSLRINEKQPGTSKFIFPLSLPSNPRSQFSPPSMHKTSHKTSSYPPSLSNIKPSMNSSRLSLAVNPEKRYLFQNTFKTRQKTKLYNLPLFSHSISPYLAKSIQQVGRQVNNHPSLTSSTKTRQKRHTVYLPPCSTLIQS